MPIFSPISLALMVGPLAIYLYTLALFQSGRGPRIVKGPIDCALLLLGLSGLVICGPIGRILVAPAHPFQVFDVGSLPALLGLLLLLALPWVARSFHRLTIYNVDEAALDLALRHVERDLQGEFVRTLRGFEDRAQARGISIEFTRWSRSAIVVAYGADPRALIGLVEVGLRDHLRAPNERPSSVAWMLLAACLVLVLPVLGIMLDRPETREMLRVLIEQIRGS